MSRPDGAIGRLPLWSAIFVAAAVVGMLAGHWLVPASDREPVATIVMDPACDLRQAGCRAVFPGGAAIEFAISPQDIPVFQPLQLEVAVAGLTADAVEIDFAGVDMNMGPNRVRLVPAEKGRFRGEGILPACVRDRMTWQAKVSVEADGGWYAAVFRFDTMRGRRGP